LVIFNRAGNRRSVAFYAVYFAKYGKIIFHMEKKTRIHVFVSGRVQGVFYRQGAKKKADNLGVFGWIKNLEDGSVEAIIEGGEESVEKMLQWAKKGTFAADVREIKINPEPYLAEFFNFEIRYNLKE
jgi:acylphosphatase